NMTLFETIAIILCLAAMASYINHAYMHLPATIGLMVISLVLSLVLIGLAETGLIHVGTVSYFVNRIDFNKLLLHGILAFFLFAGAMHVNLAELNRQKWPVMVMATLGVFFATFITGGLFWGAGQLLNLKIPLLHALLFGALIAPTDPISVLGIMKKMNTPKSLEVVITAESLFNDGVGIVVFLTLLSMVMSPRQPTVSGVSLFLLKEAVGGMALGYVMGKGVFLLLRKVNDYQVEILFTLALASGGYVLAELLHMSAPIAIVVAGLVMGNRGQVQGVESVSIQRLDLFWELVDDILNAVLFMLVGLEVIALSPELVFLALGLMSIVVVLIGRWMSIVLSVGLVRIRHPFSKGEITVMTWAGLRG
ncbi:MAG: sodium:proton antiporter, partial [Pseudomonadota bacterium]|nr:sodium:proton antiporter [Pseudomonadota bacterium]